MNTRIGWILLVIVTVVIAVAAVVLVVVPSPNEGSDAVPQPGEPFATDNVRVDAPRPNASVSTTFAVAGEARGHWYFEASFPVEVHDPSGNIVGHGIAQANGEWMTEDFVPFSATVTVADYSGPAALVLIKDNPSGLPEHADAVEFPIIVQ